MYVIDPTKLTDISPFEGIVELKRLSNVSSFGGICDAFLEGKKLLKINGWKMKFPFGTLLLLLV